MNWYFQNWEKFILLINYILANDKYLQGGGNFQLKLQKVDQDIFYQDLLSLMQKLQSVLISVLREI